MCPCAQVCVVKGINAVLFHAFLSSSDFFQNNYMEGSGSAIAHPKHQEEEETSPNRNHIITGKQQQTN